MHCTHCNCLNLSTIFPPNSVIFAYFCTISHTCKGWEWSGGSATKRGSPPSLVESCILAWVAGLIWSEIKQLWDVGLREYISDMWNVVDFITNSLYVATIGLRTVAYFDVSFLRNYLIFQYLY